MAGLEGLARNGVPERRGRFWKLSARRPGQDHMQRDRERDPQGRTAAGYKEAAENAEAVASGLGSRLGRPTHKPTRAWPCCAPALSARRRLPRRHGRSNRTAGRSPAGTPGLSGARRPGAKTPASPRGHRPRASARRRTRPRCPAPATPPGPFLARVLGVRPVPSRHHGPSAARPQPRPPEHHRGVHQHQRHR